MNRRNFLGGMAGIFAAGVAPSIGHAGILMPVRKIAVPGPVLTVAAPIRVRGRADFIPTTMYANLVPMADEVGCIVDRMGGVATRVFAPERI